MSILDGILDKAKSLLGGASEIAKRTTDVYDASKNRVLICGLEIDGVVSSTLSERAITQVDQGFDSTYYTYYDVIIPQTLTISLLPTSKSNDVLEMLCDEQRRSRGWLSIVVYENGNIIESYRGHFISLSDRQMQQEGNDRQYVFGVTTVSTPVAISQTPNNEALPINSTEQQVQNTAETYPLSEDLPIASQPLPPPSRDLNQQISDEISSLN